MLEGSSVPMLQMARQIALSHHERWNGCGYPAGLAGQSIPEAARIMALIDAYDSLTHERVYRPAIAEDESLRIIRSAEGQGFRSGDTRLVPGAPAGNPRHRSLPSRRIAIDRRGRLDLPAQKLAMLTLG